MTLSAWLMSCQAWWPHARYSQWARCKHWGPAVYFLYKMAGFNDLYLKYCQTNSTGILIWQKQVSSLMVQNFEVPGWEAALLSPSQNMRVYKEQKSQPLGALVCMCRMYRSVHRDVPSVFVCIGMGARALDRHIPNVPTQTYRHIRDKMAVVAVSLVTILVVNT